MRSLRGVVLAVSAAALFSSQAWGQFFLAPGGRGSGPSQLVLREDVQKELKLTPEQKKKVEGVHQKIRDELQEEVRKMAALDGRERDRKKMELAKRITKKSTTSMEEILTPAQMKRLKEIALQHAGVQGLKNADVEDKLKLTDEQKEQIQKTMQAAIADLRYLFEHTEGAYEESQKKAVEVRNQCYAKAMTILTPEQKKLWNELLGAPFEVKAKEVAQINPFPKGAAAQAVAKVAEPSKDPADLAWVEQRADQWKPTPQERKFDLIGWAKHDILGGVELGRKFNRPVFVFTVDGFMNRGRC
jgi:Spy/CpxP family protein refolding chaperone